MRLREGVSSLAQGVDRTSKWLALQSLRSQTREAGSFLFAMAELTDASPDKPGWTAAEHTDISANGIPTRSPGQLPPT